MVQLMEKRNEIGALIGSVLFLVIFLPKPSNLGSLVFLLLAFFFLFAAMVSFKLLTNKKLIVDKSLVLLLILQFCVIATSNVVNNEFVRPSAYVELFKPVILLLAFIYSRNLNGLTKGGYQKLLIVSVLFISLTLIDQYTKVHLFAFIYDYTGSIPELHRGVGSLVNPNFLGFVTCLLVLVCNYSMTGSKRIMFQAFLLLFILFSGSRSALVTFIIINIFSLFDAKGIKLLGVKGFVYALVTFLFLSVFTLAFIEYGKDFKYMYQITMLLHGDLLEVNSLKLRFVIWFNAMDVFNNGADYKYLIGLGALEEYRVTDNDYLSVYFKYGIMGVISIYATWIYVLFKGLSCEKGIEKGILKGCFLLMFILSFQAETFSSYIQPILLISFYASLLSKKGSLK